MGWISENLLTYTKNVGLHNVSVTVGNSTQHGKDDYSSIWGSDFPAEVSVKTLNAANIINATNTKGEWALVSFLAKANSDSEGKYL